MSDEPKRRGVLRDALSVAGGVAFLFLALFIGAAVTRDFVGPMIAYVIAIVIVFRFYSR
jgi:phosphotransferase system  glucose/maltose/N-acetylglucosamine-specific IIC component